MTQSGHENPIGVFDSGVGGLTILRAVRQALPCENLIYVADAAYVPYGDKSSAQIRDRAMAIGEFLAQRWQIKVDRTDWRCPHHRHCQIKSNAFSLPDCARSVKRCAMR